MLKSMGGTSALSQTVKRIRAAMLWLLKSLIYANAASVSCSSLGPKEQLADWVEAAKRAVNQQIRDAVGRRDEERRAERKSYQ